ncbi:hypothetical protein JCM1840_006327 [Sporobolomyces johnsonii]
MSFDPRDTPGWPRTGPAQSDTSAEQSSGDGTSDGTVPAISAWATNLLDGQQQPSWPFTATAETSTNTLFAGTSAASPSESLRYTPYPFPPHSAFPPSDPSSSSSAFQPFADTSPQQDGVSLPMLDLAGNRHLQGDGADVGAGRADLAGRMAAESTQKGGSPSEREAEGGSGQLLSAAASVPMSHGTKRKGSNESSDGGPDDASSGNRSRNGSGSGGAGAGAGAGGRKIVQKADKSCRKCRDRRVRCDRTYPTCDRCRKRRETCSYVDNVNVEEIEEGGDAQKVAQLQSKVASLERQLKAINITSPKTPSSTNTRRVSPPTTRPSADSRSSGTSSGASSRPSWTPPSGADASGPVWSSIHDVYSNQLKISPEEADTLGQFLRDSASRADLGRGSLNWRLGEPTVLRILTCHLLDSAVAACCSKIPGIKPLADRIDEYKHNLDRLDPPSQCAVAVLCALGARASPHSALLGISTADLADASPSPPLYLFAGERREMACRALERHAREVCWANNMLAHSSHANLDALIGLTQLLIYEEILPKQSRFFMRTAVGMYYDCRFEDMEKQERTSEEPRQGPGTALFLADSVISSACSKPSYISTDELDMYFITDGVPIPDIPGSNLRDEIDRCLQHPLTSDKLVDALTCGMMWVAGCSRLYAQLATSRRTGSPSPLPLLKNLWNLVDNVHNALQHVQSILVSLHVNAVSGLEDDPYALDHFVLLGVRYDSILVDLINLMHVWLMRSRDGEKMWTEREDDPFLASMRQESELRVRKCLKLLSFYAQLYLSSQDKHLVHHMMMQLEKLPEWTTWATQRIGSPGGPISEEYEVSEAELDWFQRALELSCYYNPKAAHRLQCLSAARRELRKQTTPNAGRNPQPPVGLATADHIVSQQNVFDAHSAPHQPYFIDVPTPDLRSFPPLAPGENDLPNLHAVGGGWVSHPSQLYVFDSLGVAADHGIPLDSQDPLTQIAAEMGSFQGQNWMQSHISASPDGTNVE